MVNNIKNNYFRKYEEILYSAKFGNTWLNNDKVANVVKNVLHFYNGNSYNLICYTIILNLIHLILYAIVEWNYVSLKNNNVSILYKHKNKESGDSLYKL